MSFPGYHRPYVERVAQGLAARFGQERILYDRYHTAEFANPDLAFALPQLYRAEADLTVVMLSGHYLAREWCGLEWRAIFASGVKERNPERLMLFRADDVEIPGLHGLEGFVPMDVFSPEAAVTLILQRLAINDGVARDQYLAWSPSGVKPTDAAVLDHYETLISNTRQAGRVEEAFDLFWDALGGFPHLGQKLGEYARGVRILNGFASALTPESAGAGLPLRQRARLVTAWGLFRWSVGDLSGARACHLYGSAIRETLGESENQAICLRNAVVVEIDRGDLTAARGLAVRSLAISEGAEARSGRKDSTAYLATINGITGNVAEAMTLFGRAAKLQGGPLQGAWGVREADLMLATGDSDGALMRTKGNLDHCQKKDWGRDVALCQDLLGRTDPAAAQPQLDALRAWAIRSSDVWMVLAAHRLAALHALANGDPGAAQYEADVGIAIADAHGYGLRAIDLRVVAARALLDSGLSKRALTFAREAVDAATASGCGYAWGEAEAEHLCGLAHEALEEPEHAHPRFAAASAVRHRIGHPGAGDSDQAIARLPPREG
ncbi:MAG: TIR domain-containing protein [Myxococcota bacterium]